MATPKLSAGGAACWLLLSGLLLSISFLVAGSPDEDPFKEHLSKLEDPGGPHGYGRGGEDLFCESYSWICREKPPWWRTAEGCRWLCTEARVDHGDSFSWCLWACSQFPAVPSPNSPEHAFDGDGWRRAGGPKVLIRSPNNEAVVSGWGTIDGFVLTLVPLPVTVTFGLDGEPLEVSDFAYGLEDPDACTRPLGLWWHITCRPQSGYASRFDSTPFPNGPHMLQVVAWDGLGWTTSLEVPIVIDNPDNTTQTSNLEQSSHER